jgi:glycolate oxidase iron-sulfur subunit
MTPCAHEAAPGFALSEEQMQQCAKCGSCTVVCPVYRVTGRESLAARGKLHLLGTELAGRPSAAFEDLFAQCLLCGACEDVCPRELPIRGLIVEARSRFSSLYGRTACNDGWSAGFFPAPPCLNGWCKPAWFWKTCRCSPGTAACV